MAAIHCDEVKYDCRDINEEMWKNSKKLPWRWQVFCKERNGGFGLDLKASRWN